MHPIQDWGFTSLGFDNRSILYRASLSDMVVPYGDPDPMHGWKHVFDASEASIGTIPNFPNLGFGFSWGNCLSGRASYGNPKRGKRGVQ
ncbi:MAG: hypothetical protein CM1200mP24_07860 [Gammaproteobacteria bacterium]|nr:MAG: hypothetical protein CM1200mP24_07860 [Gammaproteobacteria bacterium]